MKSDVLAAVDLGTNSAHLVVAKVDQAHIEVVEREREMIRLGSSAGDIKELSSEAMDRAVVALHRFRQVADIHAASLRVVATSAVREAGNRGVLLERARREAGVDIEVVSGFEEARLIHLGVLQAVPVFDRRLLLCDIGGGSTELVVGQQAEVLASRSFKLGAIRLTQRFFPGSDGADGGTSAGASGRAGAGSGGENGAAVEACRRHIRATLAPFRQQLLRLGHDIAVGSSGTIGAVCSMVAARRTELQGEPRPRTLNNLTVSRQEIADVVQQLVAAGTVDERARLPGLDPRRADIILAGALILEQVVESLGLTEVTFSDYALREGVLLDTWRRKHGGSLHHLSELRRRSVLTLVELMEEDPRHAMQMAELALQLFDGLADQHGLGDDSREVLEAAALLCNVGLYVSHTAHHKHSYYLIRNSEKLIGFTDREIELIAQVARYHRKSAPRLKHEAFAALQPADQDTVRILAGLLRIAVGLDRNHAGGVAEVRSRRDPERDRLVIEVVPRAGEDVSLELYSADQRKGLLEAALATTVEVTQAAAQAGAQAGAPEAPQASSGIATA